MLRRPRTFRDPKLEAQFRERGFVTLALLDAAGIEALWSAFKRVGSSGTGFHSTSIDPDVTIRYAASTSVIELLQPLLHVLTDHRVRFDARAGALWERNHPDSLARHRILAGFRNHRGRHG